MSLTGLTLPQLQGRGHVGKMPATFIPRSGMWNVEVREHTPLKLPEPPFIPPKMTEQTLVLSLCCICETEQENSGKAANQGMESS